MRVNGIQCNNCSDTVYLDPSVVGSLPNGWYGVTNGNGIVGWELHFCSKNCLEKWVQVSVVHVGNPAPAPVEYWRKDSNENTHSKM
jgi:hypothetical protein